MSSFGVLKAIANGIWQLWHEINTEVSFISPNSIALVLAH